MRKKSILWLFLLIALSISLYSCRNDYFPEKETLSNSSKFRLTSKTISLEETKHKVMLDGELQKVQGKLGKNGDLGNGVSVDTDHVIYIENGSNYHTYTFRIVKENTSENEPLENLVLSPLPDGSYKKLIFTYDFTLAEKQNLLNGIPVNTKGKTTIRDLDASIISSKVAGCVYEVETFWNECSEGIHNQFNVFAWGECTAEIAPSAYTIAYWKCSNGGGGSDGTGTGTGEGGSTPGSGGCEAEAFENPTDPVGSPGLCGGGVPTQPNVGNNTPDDPCEKTKSMLPRVSANIEDIKKQAKKAMTDPKAGEIGFKEKKDGTVVPADVNAAHQVQINNVTDGYGGYHNHTGTGIHMVSPPDIVDTLFGFAAAQSVNDGVGNAYFGMIAAEPCSTCLPDGVKYVHYVIRFSGTGSELGNFVYSPAQMTQFIKDYRKTASDLSDPYISGTIFSDSLGNLNEKGLEKLFFDTLTNIGLDNKVVLQRVEPNGTVYNLSKSSTGIITATPCP
ncbi:hypothetical protein [Chryseobacterium sp. OSA05B]|uniref:hypothetical protein n=1 Tax=Chryseobacterium sp. OSA05B TaxID=2862650 RepID=UPI001CBC628B|nr:hypothetical protein [Chryseobacterium sp. OSA05B]